MIDIGTDPERMTLHLSRDSDFGHTFVAYDGVTPADYPAGTAIRLEVKDEAGAVLATWNATVSGNTAVFAVDKAAVNTLLDVDGPKEGRIYYANGTDDDLWFVGPVRSH